MRSEARALGALALERHRAAGKTLGVIGFGRIGQQGRRRRSASR
jgi:phosphoglycerate dehydrogenase-like enzyme